jgi:hypothetical protein
MKQQYVYLIGIVLICFNCQSPTNSVKPVRLTEGRYIYESSTFSSVFKILNNDSIKCTWYLGYISDSCTISIYEGIYNIEDNYINIYCSDYIGRDNCNLPWNLYYDIAGISYPIRNITNTSFEIKSDVYWYKYSH